MEATQLIDDSILEESEEDDDGEKGGEPLAKLRVLKNKHITETELPLYQGENVLGRNPDSCSLPLVARSVSKQHTIISISMFRGNRRHGNVAAMETEALVWDLGSMNGTRKGRTKLTPHVRYALTEGECVVIADIPCQYVSVDQRGGQGHMQNPTNAHSGRERRSGPDRKAQLRGSPSGQGLGRETGTPKTEGRGVNGEIGAPSLTELGGKGKNLAKPLSFEQTPTQPERTLVPESDSDGEREGRRDKRGKYFVSDSDSHMSSPTCSTFLSPTTKVIPESEDESPITPSSSAKNRPKKIVSFSDEESDMDGPRQQPRRRRAQVIVDDSEEEEEEEGKEGTDARGEKETGKRTRVKEDVSVVNQVSQAERDRLTLSAPMVSTEDTFNMDSDTDVEGEEEMGLSAPVNAVKPPAATEPPTTDSDPGQIHMDSDTDVEGEEEMGLSAPVNAVKPPAATEPPTTDSDPGQIHMDSDTDVEEGDTMDGDSKLMLTAADVERKPVDSVPVVQPTEIHLDSDTDVDDDVVVSDSATNVTSFVSDPAEKPDDPAPAVPPVEFHPDTDTDVEEEDTDTHSKTVPESDSSGIRTGIAGPQEILLDSDTDEEDNPFTPPASSRTAELLNPPTSVGPAAAAPLEIRSDSDTDLEEDATQTMNLPPPNVTTVTEDAVLASRLAVLPSPTITTTTGAVTKTIALRSQDSDADTDAEEERLEPKPPRCRPPAGMVPESDLSEPSDFRVDSDTEEDGPGEAGQGQTACRLREGAAGPGLLPLGGSPGPHQKCSTPLASSVQEEMETQAFFCPSDPFRRPALPPVLRPTAALSCSASDSQEDDDFVVAETQSFVLEAQNQGHQSSLPVEPTLDSTQPYGLEPSLGEDREEQPSRGSFQLGLSDSIHLHLQARDQASESTQAFSFPGGDSDLEATQTYGSGGGSEEPGLGQRSAVFGRNRQVDFALEATQAYAAQPRSDTEDEEETQPLEFPTPSNVATTETLPMSAYEEEDGEEEEDLVGAKPLTPVRRGRSGGAREREEEEQETQTGEVLTNQYLSTAQTLNMVQESDDEEEAKPDSPRRRRTQKQTVDEEETQTVGSYLSTAETQPMFIAAAAEDDDDNEEEELKPPSPRRRGRSQRGRVEEEETQPSEFLTSSHISTTETQPMGTCDTEEEEEEDTKAKGQAQRERGKESEAGTSGVSSRGRKGARGGEEETLKTQMKGKAVNTAGGGGRREVLPEEEESEKEEEAEVVEQGRRGRGRKSVKQQKEGEKERLEEERREEEEGIEKERQEQPEKERLRKEKVESERVMKEQHDRERMEQELQEQDERLESVEREETERMEREKIEETERMEREKREQEKREETERMEREKREETERMEREKREQEKREETERMEREKREQEKREKTERMEREKIEQEKREETERMEREKREETERMEREKREQEKREETERMEREKREETERIEREKREETERMEREKREQEKREETERMEREKREETERMEREKREETERMEREKREQEKREETERMEREKREQEKREETERMEREKREQEKREETERMESEKREQEKRERLERERKEREEQERLQCERTKREKERLEEEKERIERERKEIEERNRLEREEKEKQERLERENREREALERSERERVEKERIEGEQAEKQRLEKEKMEREEKRKQERELLKKKKEENERNMKEKLEREKKEREKREAEEKEKEIKERQAKEQGEKQAKNDDENELKTSRRGRRATTRRTVTVPPTTEPQPELNILSSTPEPVPASITRSRSNSSNSVSSERSSIETLGSRGRGGRKTTSTTEPAPGPDNPTRNSTRRRTLVGTVVAPPAAVEVTVQDILSSKQFVARRTRSSSTNSHSSTNSEVSACIVDSVSSQSKGRGGGRRKTGTESLSPSNRQSEQPPAPKPTARGRRSQKVEDEVPHPVINEKADSQEAGGTTRGQKKTDKTNEPDPVVADEETSPAQVTEDSPAPRGNGRGRGRAGQKDNTPESTTTTAGGDTPSEEGVESKTGGRVKGRKRGLEEEEEEENSGFKVPRRKAKVQRGGRCRAAEEEGEKEEKPASTPAKRDRASTAQVKKIAEEEKSMERQSEKMEEEEAGAVQRKVRGRQSTVQIKKKEEPVLDSNSVVPQTPTGKGRGKRRAPVESSPLARTPRSSSASPLSSLSSPGTLGPARAATQSYKVLFTGVVDEEGGKVVSFLGGSLAKGVADMTHLVTDRVRRTVKFLCAVARGVPVVTTDWLDKCGKVGRFLPTDRYLVKDREQENKFSFCLEESLRTASTQPLLQGYEVHVTRSVLPEPAQMKDIIVCSGARFLSMMPSTQKAQARTLVISCGEDWSLCAPALSASLPVLSAEFLLTGILQQRVDLVTHVLSAPKPRAQPGAKGQARGRK